MYAAVAGHVIRVNRRTFQEFHSCGSLSRSPMCQCVGSPFVLLLLLVVCGVCSLLVVIAKIGRPSESMVFTVRAVNY